MYTEIDLIKAQDTKAIRLKLCLLFLKEYSAWYEHLKTVGHSWGVAGEREGAYTESIKTKRHIDEIEALIFKEFNENGTNSNTKN